MRNMNRNSKQMRKLVDKYKEPRTLIDILKSIQHSASLGYYELNIDSRGDAWSNRMSKQLETLGYEVDVDYYVVNVSWRE